VGFGLALGLALALAGVSPAPSLAQTPFPTPPPASRDPAVDAGFRSRLRLAGEYLKEKRWEEALDLYREIVAGDPDSGPGRRGLKACLLELKLYDELQEILEDELARWGEHPTVLEELGTVAARRGDRETAARRWRRILEIQQHTRGAYTFVADLMIRNRLLDEALDVYAEAERRHPGRFLRQKAALHELRFEFDAATVEYLRFLESSPTALSFVEGRLMRIGESEEGLGPVIERTENWIRTAPRRSAASGNGEGGGAPSASASPALHTVFRKLLGDLYLEAGNHEAAREEYFRLVDEMPSQYGALLVFGKRCQTDGEHEVAIRVFERIVAEIDDAKARPSALSEIAAGYAALGRWDEALATWTRLEADYPETDFAYRGKLETGRILREGKRDPVAAEAVFRELIAIGEGPWPEAEPQFQVAECAVWSGDLEMAGGIYSSMRARRFSPDTMERALFEEARVRFYRNELAVADSLFKEVAQVYPKGLHVNDALQFSILINTNPDEAEVLGKYAAARLKMRTKDPDGAVALLQELDREHEIAAIRDEALLLQGRALRAAGHPQRALATLERAISEAMVMDLAAEAHFLRGSILAEDLGDAAAALAEYEELLVTYPETLAADRARDLTADLSRMLP
jgi:tetratricopeptide (TPR) repeat protein